MIVNIDQRNTKKAGAILKTGQYAIYCPALNQSKTSISLKYAIWKNIDLELKYCQSDSEGNM